MSEILTFDKTRIWVEYCWEIKSIKEAGDYDFIYFPKLQKGVKFYSKNGSEIIKFMDFYCRGIGNVASFSKINNYFNDFKVTLSFNYEKRENYIYYLEYSWIDGVKGKVLSFLKEIDFKNLYALNLTYKKSYTHVFLHFDNQPNPKLIDKRILDLFLKEFKDRYIYKIEVQENKYHIYFKKHGGCFDDVLYFSDKEMGVIHSILNNCKEGFSEIKKAVKLICREADFYKIEKE